MPTQICARCSRHSDAIELWDGRSYCKPCIERASPDLVEWALNDELRDVLRREQVHGLRYLAYIWPRFMLAMLLIGAIPWMAAIFEHGRSALVTGLFVLAALGTFALVFFGLQALLGHFVFRARLPRETAIRNGKLFVAWRGKVKECDLAGCSWYEGNASVDYVEMFTRLRRAVVLRSPHGVIAIGHEPGSAERWRAFFMLSRFGQRRPEGCLRMIWLSIVGVVCGTFAGVLVGSIVAAAAGDAIWRGMLGFLGAIDGFALPIYSTASAEHSQAARRRLNPLVVGLGFSAIGLKVGGIDGWPGRAACMGINFVLGLCLGWLCLRKIRRDEIKRQSAPEWVVKTSEDVYFPVALPTA